MRIDPEHITKCAHVLLLDMLDDVADMERGILSMMQKAGAPELFALCECLADCAACRSEIVSRLEQLTGGYIAGSEAVKSCVLALKELQEKLKRRR